MRNYIKEVGLHGLVYSISTLAGSAMGFILIPLLTAYLSAEEYGIVANVQSLVNLFNVLFAFGMTVTWSRFWFDYEENSREQRRFLGTTLVFIFGWSLLLCGLLMLGGSALFNRLLPGVNFYPFIVISMATSFFMVFFNQQQILFRVRRKSLWFGLLNVGRLVFTVGLTVVGVVMLHRGALGKATADLIVAAAGFLIVAFMLLRRATLCVDWPMLRESLRYALPVLPHTLAVVVLQITDKFFLTNLKGLDDAGIYSVGFKFGSIMSIIVYSTNLSWQPFFMKTAAEKGDEAPPIFARMTTYWLMVMVFLAIGITLFSHEAVYLFTLSAPFRAAAPLVPIFVFAYLLYGLYLLAATQVFYAKRAVKVLPFITVAAGVLNIVLNAVMIPRWGIFGAAWATFCSYVVNLALAALLAQKHYSIPYEWKRLGALGLLSAAVVAAYYGVQAWSPTLAVSLSIRVALLLMWLLALAVGGFLSPSERANMKDMLRKMLAARRSGSRGQID